MALADPKVATGLDVSLGFLCPVLGVLLTVKGAAVRRMTLEADFDPVGFLTVFPYSFFD
jgi:hypothetical protein